MPTIGLTTLGRTFEGLGITSEDPQMDSNQTVRIGRVVYTACPDDSERVAEQTRNNRRDHQTAEVLTRRRVADMPAYRTDRLLQEVSS